MADSTTVVAPNIAVLRAIAKKYHDGAANLTQWSVSVSLAKITPGSFDMAGALLKIWNTRRDGLVTFLTDLRDAMTKLAQQLNLIADRYASTDALNADDAGRVAELIQAFQDKYPGISDTVPKPPNTFSFPST